MALSMEEHVFRPSIVASVRGMDASHTRNGSLVTVRLSEPVHLKINTKFEVLEESQDDRQHDTPRQEEDTIREEVAEEDADADRLGASSGMSTIELEEHSLAIELETAAPESRRGSRMPSIDAVEDERQASDLDSQSTIKTSRGSGVSNMTTSEEQSLLTEPETQDPLESLSRRESNDSQGGEVNWAELQKSEADEPKDEGSEDSTALLLARLEQENNRIVSNPKAVLTQEPSSAPKTRPRGQSRPPSMGQLRRMVNEPQLPALRYSLVPAPPMTDLEFYTALVQDYPKTLRRLPTLVSKKIRGGIPPPLRGVVWQSMAGSRDLALQAKYERLSGETSPYEGAIGKDLNRSFPGVDMFRDPEGDGQRMLGKVLKCFSLYDTKIGYCQGLGFLVGPLLMHMPDKEAFCLLVKLMEQYGLRDCFLPDLSGLHVRIYQFRQLLKQHIPSISAHLEMLQIEPAYVSQWFLSFFAVTCPLPMLFRIFDVIFAEGASETLMRVALSLMRRNEVKILACTELEDVMQLLLSRGIWDCYHSNANELVNDFVTFSGVVTHETLQNLELAYKNSRAEVRTSDVGSMASRILGRLWTGSTTASVKSTSSLSPGLSAPQRPGSFLRRSASKYSIASTLDSVEGGSDSAMSTSTDATTISRDSSNTDSCSIRIQSYRNGRKMTAMSGMSAMSGISKKDSDFHTQIEDLLTAIGELQRENAQLETQIQTEKEEREEDKIAVRALLYGLTRKSRMEALQMVEGDRKKKTTSIATTDVKDFASLGKWDAKPGSPVDPSSHITQEELSSLLDAVEDRTEREKSSRRPSISESKHQLRDELTRSKEQLVIEVSKSQDLARRLAAEEQEASNLREQVRESHAHTRNAHSEKQRLERQVGELRQAARNSKDKSLSTSPDGSEAADGSWSGRSSANSSVSAGGLRELKLGRSSSARSTRTTFSKRTSSLINPLTQPVTERRERDHENSSSISSLSSTASSISPPPSNTADNEALILELVEAKTAKVLAEQEVEEMKGKLESMRKKLAQTVGSGGHNSGGSQPDKAAPQTGFMSYVTGATAPVETPSLTTTAPLDSISEPKPATPAAAAPTGGGFWGWGKRS